jgi:transposase-like protein
LPKTSPVPVREILPEADRREQALGASGAAVETTPRRTRRVFSAADKLRIVKKADACIAGGERGALEAMLREEGLYSSALSSWRGQLGRQGVAGLEPRKMGRKPKLDAKDRLNANRCGLDIGDVARRPSLRGPSGHCMRTARGQDLIPDNPGRRVIAFRGSKLHDVSFRSRMSPCIRKDRTMKARHSLVNARLLGPLLLGAGLVGACANTSGGSTTGGGGASGGATSSGGSAAGGTTQTGGVTGAGGTTGLGGQISTGLGGRFASGGAVGVGGSTSGGGSGGGVGLGGATGAQGGATGSFGGGLGTGGAQGVGGDTGRGGVTGTGGAAGSPGSGGPAVAFPGALGFGKKATGGRGYAVYHVTNLNDTGTGSFRDAVSASNRIVVFDVGGYVNLQTPVSVKSNLTIAGQTAPGDGIGFQGREVSFDASSNVIVRYVRFRQGLLDSDAKKSGINLLDATNLIFDHISIEFAQYNNVDAVGATNITIQNSIDADPTGQQFGAHTEMTGGFFTWYGNLFANAHGRCPLAKSNTQYVNNVVYNYQYAYAAGDTSGVFWHDIVHNYFIAGPSTTAPGDYFYQMNATQTVYINGNLADTNRDGTLNGTDAGYPGGTTHSATAASADTAALPTTSAAASYAAVVASAGASLHRDQVDALVIADLTSLGKTGSLWTNQTATGLGNSGYGTLAGGTAPTDTDKDGMPDTWETKYGLDPNNPADATGDFDHTGYTNVEKYINSIADGLYP